MEPETWKTRPAKPTKPRHQKTTLHHNVVCLGAQVRQKPWQVRRNVLNLLVVTCSGVLSWCRARSSLSASTSYSTRLGPQQPSASQSMTRPHFLSCGSREFATSFRVSSSWHSCCAETGAQPQHSMLLQFSSLSPMGW